MDDRTELHFALGWSRLVFGSLQEIALLLEMNSLQLILIEKTVFPKGTLFSMDG